MMIMILKMMRTMKRVKKTLMKTRILMKGTKILKKLNRRAMRQRQMVMFRHLQSLKLQKAGYRQTTHRLKIPHLSVKKTSDYRI